MIEHVLDNTATLAESILPPGHWAQATLTAYSYNPEQARHYLHRYRQKTRHRSYRTHTSGLQNLHQSPAPAPGYPDAAPVTPRWALILKFTAVTGGHSMPIFGKGDFRCIACPGWV